MASSAFCYPYWHGIYAPIADSLKNQTIRSGCSVSGDGHIHCSPEDMRANAESQLAALGFPKSISLDAYSLARTMQSEVGNRSLEESVALGELTRNQARRRGISSAQLLLTNNSGQAFYGPIHGIGTGVSTAPYGRFASTSLDPSALTLLLAELVDSGASGDFIEGGVDQDGPEAWAGQGQAALNNYVSNTLARNRGLYWIGPKPGIDHWHTFIQYKPGPFEDKAALLQRGLDALTLPVQRPAWPADLPICSKPAGGALLWTIGILATIGGAWWAANKV